MVGNLRLHALRSFALIYLMPYADPAQQRAVKARFEREKYRQDPSHAEAERQRQRELYAANRERIIARVLARRAELREAREAGKKGKR